LQRRVDVSSQLRIRTFTKPAGAPRNVLQSALLIAPSASESNRKQRSAELLPLRFVRSRLADACSSYGLPAPMAEQNCVTSFWPGSSFGPSTSTMHRSANAGDASVNTKRHASALVAARVHAEVNLVERSLTDIACCSIGGLLPPK